MMRMARKLWKDESGVSTVEYALLLTVLVVGAVSVWTSLGEAISSTINSIANTISESP